MSGLVPTFIVLTHLYLSLPLLLSLSLTLSPSLSLSCVQFPIVVLLANMAVQPGTVTQLRGVSVIVDTSSEGLEDSVKVRPGRYREMCSLMLATNSSSVATFCL